MEPEDDEAEDTDEQLTPNFAEFDVPDHTMTDEEVESLEFRYSIRGPNDYVVSRPVDTFRDAAHADRWARLRFGDRYRGRNQEAEEFGRYCFIVKKKGC